MVTTALAALNLLNVTGGWWQSTSASGRAVAVVSDLHMGIGRDGSGAWHAAEDFRWAPEFRSFLTALDREGKGASDLVLNGDVFELLQSPAPDCAGWPELGCTEAEAVARLDRVLAAHSVEIAAIADFARRGSNRVVFVPGDSDAALLFPKVRRRLLGAVAAPAARVDVASSGFWASPDGRIYTEHGHQIGSSAHKLEGWPTPFTRRAGRTYLTRSPGEKIGGDAYRRLEPRYPVVDNVAALGAGVKYAMAADGQTDASERGSLLRYLLFTTIAWQQFRMELDDGDVEPPAWDLAQVRAQGGALLASAVPDDDPLRALATKALADGALDPVALALADEEIVALCDYRAAVRRARRRYEPSVSQFVPRGPVIAECPRTPESRGATFDYFWRSRDLVFSRHLGDVTRRLPRGLRPTVFVHGHTHLPDRSQTRANMISGGLLEIPMEGFSPVRRALAPVVINGGAWQRTITPVQLQPLLSERTLPTVQPEDLPACYSFVYIGPYADAPAPSVRYWRQDGSGAWAMEGSCGG
jgi:hypothetical protein